MGCGKKAAGPRRLSEPGRQRMEAVGVGSHSANCDKPSEAASARAGTIIPGRCQLHGKRCLLPAGSAVTPPRLMGTVCAGGHQRKAFCHLTADGTAGATRASKVAAGCGGPGGGQGAARGPGLRQPWALVGPGVDSWPGDTWQRTPDRWQVEGLAVGRPLEGHHDRTPQASRVSTGRTWTPRLTWLVG